MNQVPEFIYSSICSVHFLSEAGENLSGFITEKLNQDIVLVFEVQIDGPIGHTGFSGDFGNGRLMISVPGKYLDGRFEDAVVFIVFIAGTDGLTPA